MLAVVVASVVALIAESWARHQGKFLAEKIVREKDPRVELVFVWNRTSAKIRESDVIDSRLVLENLDDFERFGADLIVEVAHPIITEQYAAR